MNYAHENSRPFDPEAIDQDEVTSPHQLAALFLAFTEGTEDPDDYENDPRVPSIVDALHRVGINRVAGVLGTGSFGIAAHTEDGHVVKLTADPAEVQIGALLVGKRLPHVVSVFGAWYVCGVRVNVAVRQNEYGSLEREPLRAGILVEQLVDAGHLDEEGSRLSATVFNFKEQSGNRFEDYSRLSPKARRQKLFEASQQLEAVLRSQGRPLFTDVADALRELRSEGIFAIDVHGGNVGWDNRAKAYRVFDVGVGSTPPGSPQPPCRGPRGHTRQQQQVAEAVAPPTRVLEIGEAPRARPSVRRTTPGLTEYVAEFLSRVEHGTGDAFAVEKQKRDPRTPIIVNALEHIGVRTIDKKLGFGSFGLAARTGDGYVVKLTSDPTETHVGTVLVGKNLPHVAGIYGAWNVCGVNVTGFVGTVPVGVLIEQMMDATSETEEVYGETAIAPSSFSEQASHLTDVVLDFKSENNLAASTLRQLDPHERRERLRVGSIDLAGLLMTNHMRLLDDVAHALHELYDEGVYAIDVHEGNVGWDAEAKRYRVFDIGVGSPPPGTRVRCYRGLPRDQEIPQNAPSRQLLNAKAALIGAVTYPVNVPEI